MTAREIKFHLLNKEELTYEVTIRSETPAETVTLLRKQLRKLLTECSSEELIETDLEPGKEITEVERKLKELQTYCGSLDQAPKTLARTKALAYHLYHRLNRIKPESSVEKQKLASCSSLLQSLLKKIEPSEENAEDTQEEEAESTPAKTGEKNVAKWDVKFNGLTDPRSFLDRVEDLRRADGVSSAKLLNSAARLFTDQALVWFRSIRSKVTSWSELTKLLLLDFSAADYDFKLRNEICLRTQGADEPLHIYFSIMRCMFDRLHKQLPEEEKLDILKRNIRPFYSQQLALVEVTSIDDLEKKCKVIEVTRQRCVDFSEPEKQKFSVLTSEFLYKPKRASPTVATVRTNQGSTGGQVNSSKFNQPKSTSNNNYHRMSNTADQTTENFRVASTRKICYKCGKTNHDFSKCTDRKNKCCYLCGKLGHFSKQCPDRNTGSKN